MPLPSVLNIPTVLDVTEKARVVAAGKGFGFVPEVDHNGDPVIRAN